MYACISTIYIYIYTHVYKTYKTYSVPACTYMIFWLLNFNEAMAILSVPHRPCSRGPHPISAWRGESCESCEFTGVPLAMPRKEYVIKKALDVKRAQLAFGNLLQNAKAVVEGMADRLTAGWQRQKSEKDGEREQMNIIRKTKKFSKPLLAR